MSDKVIDLDNSLTDEQRKEMSDKIGAIMTRYMRDFGARDGYFAGVVDGLNTAYKVINSIDDDYNFR